MKLKKKVSDFLLRRYLQPAAERAAIPVLKRYLETIDKAEKVFKSGKKADKKLLSKVDKMKVFFIEAHKDAEKRRDLKEKEVTFTCWEATNTMKDALTAEVEDRKYFASDFDSAIKYLRKEIKETIDILSKDKRFNKKLKKKS